MQQKLVESFQKLKIAQASLCVLQFPQTNIQDQRKKNLENGNTPTPSVRDLVFRKGFASFCNSGKRRPASLLPNLAAGPCAKFCIQRISKVYMSVSLAGVSKKAKHCQK